jgi:hypothetical protein
MIIKNLFAFCFVVVFLAGCASTKIPVGVFSSFELQMNQSWVREISPSHVEIFEYCCFNEDIPHFLHRVIEDDRGFIILIGAGETFSKSDLLRHPNLTNHASIVSGKLSIQHGSWRIDEKVELYRYVYDEPKSGIVVSYNILVGDETNKEACLEWLANDFISAIHVKGL